MNSLSKIEASENLSEMDHTESSDIATILKERFDILADEKKYYSFLYYRRFYFLL